MLNKVLAAAVVTLLLSLHPMGVKAAADAPILDTSTLEQGTISIHYPTEAARTLIRITKDEASYDYHGMEGAHYPLQLGNGLYHVLIAELVGGNKYKVVTEQTVELQLENENTVFLQSIPLIRWTSETKAVLEAAELTRSRSTELDKVAAIYTYMTHTMKYDKVKAQQMPSDYVPDLDQVYDAASGICYDFAATFAAMARSQQLPTRLVMGYYTEAPETYHAWNQVYLKESRTWVTLDTTYDAARIQNGQDPPMLKDPAQYTISEIY